VPHVPFCAHLDEQAQRVFCQFLSDRTMQEHSFDEVRLQALLAAQHAGA